MTVAVTSSTDPRPKRAFCSHQPKWQRFQPTLLISESKTAAQNEQETFQYQRQYSHVYSQRLTALRPRCWKSFEGVTGGHDYTRTNRVLELREDVHSRIVGTLVKETTDRDEATIGTTNCRPSDSLFLEDESGRVALDIRNPHQYCTGVVVGIQGKVDNLGVFHVDQLVLPAPAPAPKLDDVSLVSASLPGSNDEGDSSKVAPHLLLISSLLCGDPNVPSVPREMLLSYLQGQFTKDAAKVCHVLVLGGGPSSQEPLLGVKEFDAFLLQLTKAGIPVDVMPGKLDPTTANWPQRPLHSSLLPHATAIVHRTPNPYAATLGPQFIVATDGANVRDLQQHVTTDSLDEEPARLTQLQALTRTLEWSHICPTGPDSLPTVPHMEQDPMVLDNQPSLYVSGNADQFAKATVNGTTILCVPKFSETGEAVMVNLETLAVERLQFKEE